MGDDLRKVRPGDPLRIPARAYNAFVDAALETKRRQQDRRGGELWDGGRSFIGGGVVAVRNDSGADLDRYHVLAVGEPLFLPDDDGPEKSFQNRLAFKGIKPTDATRPGSFAIAREPIPQGEVGLCVVHGVTPARVLIEDEEHAFADVAPDETVLASAGTGGTVILWKEEGVGEKWALVEVGRPRGGRIVAILGEGREIEGERFRWRYPWTEAAIDGDPGSDTFGRYIALEEGLSSKGAGGEEDPARWALNRFESHHSDMPEEEPEGTDGFGGLRSLFVPGQLEPLDPAGYCPRKAAVPMLRPILKGVAVEMFAERDTRGKTVWAFQALNGMELVEFDVPVWLYV
jgi:hypothetical protein